ncbi:MAG TPA: DUF4340 domain-containing protein [Chthoniobacterales bacterium]|nr:DUF4340 domain-containing protein [Chthoniobacterales bacterium]
MKRTQLAILILLVVVLAAAAFVLARRSTTSWQSSTEHLADRLVNLPINDVAQISIQQPKAEVNLRKKGDSWVVTDRADYPANFEMISTLIRKVWELKPVQEVEVGPSQLGRLSLLEPGQGEKSGTLVDFKNAGGKRLAAVLFGKKYLRESDQSFARGRAFPAGRYVMPEDGIHHVSLVTDTFQQIDDQPERWLDRDFIKIEKPISIAVAGPSLGMNWKLEREPASKEWRLADGKPEEKLDETKATQIANSVGNIASFRDVLAPDAKPETTGLDKPVSFTVTTEDGFTYILNVGKKRDESYPLMVAVSANLPRERHAAKEETTEEKTRADKEFQTRRESLEKKLAKEKKLEGRIFLVPKFGIEQLEKNRPDLLAPKPTLTPSPSPAASSTKPNPK